MEKYSTFGECLAAVLNALELKCSKMAREINVDPSLIYRWLRNERVPSYDTSYIEQISTYVTGKICNSYQMEAISDLLKSHGIDAPSDTEDLQKKIKMWLEESQGYSLMLRKKAKSLNRRHLDSSTKKSSQGNRASGTDRVICKPVLDNQDSAANRDFVCYHDHIDVIKGSMEVAYAAIRLLSQAIKAPVPDDNKILITLNSKMNILLDDKFLRQELTQTLKDALSHGWSIIFQIRINDNVERTTEIIEIIQPLLSHGNIIIYYHQASDENCAVSELCIVPSVGALFIFSSKADHPANTAFWYHEKECMEALASYFFQYLTFAKPLLRLYPSPKTIHFLNACAEAEEAPGDKYAFKNGLNTITMPLSLYERYISCCKLSEHEISLRKFLHGKRLESFESQVNYYKYKDICPIESLEKLVKDKKYPMDEYYMLDNRILSNEDIVCHLENLVKMLERYDNYEIAFVSEKDFEDLYNVCWEIKGHSRIFIESMNRGGLTSDDSCTKRNYSSAEKHIVNGFRHYFLKIWDEIPTANKDKSNAIQFIKSLIRACMPDRA